MWWFLLACVPALAPGSDTETDASTGPTAVDSDTETEAPSATASESDTEPTGETEPTSTGDTGLVCASGTVLAEDLALWWVDGAPNTQDGLSGYLEAGPDPLGGTSAWVLGRSADLPSPGADGVVTIYAGLEVVGARIFEPAGEGELDSMTAGDLDGDGDFDAVVGIEDTSQVSVHFDVAGTVRADAGDVLITAASWVVPAVEAEDLDGDGVDDLVTSWWEEVEVWSGPLSSGSYLQGDGSQQLDGSTRLWIRAGDLDGDGYAELVLPRKHETDLAVLLGGVTGFTADLTAPDHVLEADGLPGEDDGGIRLADLAGDGTPDILATVVATAPEDPALLVWPSLTADPIAVSTGETGRYAVATLDADGDGDREVVLGRFPYTGVTGGLLVYDDLDGEPLRIEPEGDSLLGAAIGDGVDVDGDGRDELLTVDPWGAGEEDPRLWVLSLCR